MDSTQRGSEEIIKNTVIHECEEGGPCVPMRVDWPAKEVRGERTVSRDPHSPMTPCIASWKINEPRVSPTVVSKLFGSVLTTSSSIRAARYGRASQLGDLV